MTADTPGNADADRDADEVLAPVPDPGEDLSHLAVFEEEPIADAAPDDSPDGVATAAYDDETDLAVPVHDPDTSAAFTPFGGSVPDAVPHPAYDVERDTGR